MTNKVTQSGCPLPVERAGRTQVLSHHGDLLSKCQQAIAEAMAGEAQAATEIQNEAAPGELKAEVKE